MDSAQATSKRPFQGLGVSATIRGTARAQRECASRFPLQKREESERFFPLFVCRRMRGLGTCDLKTPLPGAGGVCNNSRNRSRAARVRVPFSAPRQKGESLGILLFCFCMPTHGGLGTCDLKTPLPGAGGVCRDSRNSSRAARVRVPFSAPKEKKRESLKDSPLCVAFQGLEPRCRHSYATSVCRRDGRSVCRRAGAIPRR